MTPSEESMTLMTSYHFPQHGYRSFAIASGWRLMVFDIASGWRLSSVVILNGGKNAVQKKRETGQWHRVKNLWFWWHLTTFLTTVTDPSLSLQDDVLWSSSSQQQVFDIASGWRLSSVVILNGGKNAVQEKRETGQWHRVKNLWFWWHLTAFLTTGTEPSHSLRMTFNVFLTTTANPLLIFRMTPNGNHMLRLLTHS